MLLAKVPFSSNFNMLRLPLPAFTDLKAPIWHASPASRISTSRADCVLKAQALSGRSEAAENVVSFRRWQWTSQERRGLLIVSIVACAIDTA